MFDNYEGMTEELRYKNAVVTNLEKIVKLLEGRNPAIEEATITLDEKPKRKRTKKE